ncbi:MAG: aldo/keto reductase [Oscillospiraceae bacterium]
MEYTTLNNGVKIPMLGYGVFRVPEAECRSCVSDALEAGYRLIDTAAAYENEGAVGQAIESSGIKREELFITTKLQKNGPGRMTMDEFERSMEKLRLDYVDLYLIHQPFGDVYSAWRCLEELYDSGRVRAIGVSNFSSARLTDLMCNNRLAPALNQIEINPFDQKSERVAYMKENGVQPQAWAPLAQGKGNFFENEVLTNIGKKYGKSPAQVALRWQIERGVVAIPKTTKKARMTENIDIFDFSLSDEDMAAIAGLETGNPHNLHEDVNFIKFLCSKWNLLGTAD